MFVTCLSFGNISMLADVLLAPGLLLMYVWSTAVFEIRQRWLGKKKNVVTSRKLNLGTRRRWVHHTVKCSTLKCTNGRMQFGTQPKLEIIADIAVTAACCCWCYRVCLLFILPVHRCSFVRVFFSTWWAGLIRTTHSRPESLRHRILFCWLRRRCSV